MKNLENIDMDEMKESELKDTRAGWFGDGAETLAFIILYISVRAIPKLIFA